jgi:hypothetical protein
MLRCQGIEKLFLLKRYEDAEFREAGVFWLKAFSCVRLRSAVWFVPMSLQGINAGATS